MLSSQSFSQLEVIFFIIYFSLLLPCSLFNFYLFFVLSNQEQDVIWKRYSSSFHCYFFVSLFKLHSFCVGSLFFLPNQEQDWFLQDVIPSQSRNNGFLKSTLFFFEIFTLSASKIVLEYISL